MLLSKNPDCTDTRRVPFWISPPMITKERVVLFAAVVLVSSMVKTPTAVAADRSKLVTSFKENYPRSYELDVYHSGRRCGIACRTFSDTDENISTAGWPAVHHNSRVIRSRSADNHRVAWLDTKHDVRFRAKLLDAISPSFEDLNIIRSHIFHKGFEWWQSITSHRSLC